jgi:antitoxin component of MazEF toxin-antitoxin module
MQKSLIPIGNSLGVIIPRAILELLKMDKGTPIELSLNDDGTGLVIVPATAHRSRVRTSAKRMMKAHSATLKKLAK